MRAPLLVLLLALLACPAAAAEDEWILTFENGDTLHCRLETLTGNQLTVRWTVAPDEPVRLDAKSIAFLVRADEEEAPTEPPPDMEILRLVDDCVLYGHAVSVTPDGVEFEVPSVGRLPISAKSILHLAREDGWLELPEQKAGEFAVALNSGAKLVGKLHTDERGNLVLVGDGIEALIDRESMAVLAYPPDSGPAVATEPPTDPRAQIRLRNGSVLGGRQPTLADGNFRITIDGREATVAMKEVAAISFRENWMPFGRVGRRAVFVWGRWADDDDEFRKTVEILKQELDPRWRLVENSADKYDEAFRRELFGCGTMVIPEMENLKEPSGDAEELKPVVQAFVRSGGNVIICGVQSAHFDWVRMAGLFNMKTANGVDGKTVKFTRKGAALGKDIAPFSAMNATFAYAVNDSDAFSLAETDGGSVVVARRVGRGWIICIGLDYYSTNEGASKLLGNAVRMR